MNKIKRFEKKEESKIGDDSWEEVDERIMKQIQKHSEDIPFPKGLEPENMMKKIKEENKKNNKKHATLKKIVAIGTAAALCMITIYQAFNISGRTVVINHTNVVEEKEWSPENALIQVSDQSEIYSKIKNYQHDSQDSNMDLSKYEMMGQSDNYFEVTNEQVEGVEEGDKVKTDGKYIYLSQKDNIAIVSAENGSMENVAQINYKKDLEENVGKDIAVEQKDIKSFKVCSQEINIQEDMLTVVANCLVVEKAKNKENENSGDRYYVTYILSFDISDRQSPKLISKHSQEGGYLTSRIVDGYLYVLSTYNYFLEKDEKFIPIIDGKEAGVETIYIDENREEKYTVITALEIKRPETLISNINILSKAEIVYVSKGNIYLTESIFSYYKPEVLDEVNLLEKKCNETIISRFGFDLGKLSTVTSAKINGNIQSQFFMDEYNDTLRVVTKNIQYNYLYLPLDKEEIKNKFKKNLDNMNRNSDEFDEIENEICEEYGMSGEIVNFKNKWYFKTANYENYTSVSVLDSKLNLVGEIEGIAKDEKLYSARFMENMGYFVTFEQVDPLFAVDFSDINNPKIVSKLEVPGFSEYLHFWEEDKLLGIGYETESFNDGGTSSSAYKLSMFDISNPLKVTEENKHIINGMSSTKSSDDYKNYLISREKNIIGLALNDENKLDYNINYKIFSYDSTNGFHEEFCYETKPNTNILSIKGIIINDTLYIISEGKKFNIQSYDINQNYMQISNIDI